MATFKVVLTDQVFPSIDIETELLARIGATIEIADGTREDVLARVGDADALLNTYFSIDRKILDAMPRCKIVARYGIGIDNVDLEAARERGVVITNVPDYSVEEVAAHALALTLALLRRLTEAEALLRSGGWSVKELRPIRRISTLTAGLIGYGRIARRFADALRTLGMRILVFDPYLDQGGGDFTLVASLEDLLSAADIVSVHAPLTPETRGMIGAPQLAVMREEAILVNTSRGGLVVLDDVADALRNRAIRGAALDVFDAEPLDPSRIEGIPNLLVTPHMAYYSEEALQESQRKASTQIVKVLTGAQPDYPVSP